MNEPVMLDDVSTLMRMFDTMLLIRRSEERLADLIEQGEIGCPCHLCIGQEAIAVGVCMALQRDDYVWGGHRSHGHYLAKGGGLKEMFAEIFGRETGCSAGRGGSMHLLAPAVGVLGTVPIVSATIPLAVGAAMAAKMRREERVSVSFFGDGATEEGQFHESMNLAALYKLPVVFVCENNLYASHMNLSERRAIDGLDRTGESCGVPGTRVDGNDVLKVYRTASEAVHRARSGAGPTLLECRTYRWRGHVGPSTDMDVGVKRKNELAEWKPRDPILRLQNALRERGVEDVYFERAAVSVRESIEEAVEFARRSPFPAAASVTEHVFVARRS